MLIVVAQAREAVRGIYTNKLELKGKVRANKKTGVDNREKTKM